MTWFDAGALVLVALAIADGAIGGLVWSAVELTSLVVAALLARALAPLAAPYVAKILDLSPATEPWAAHLILWIGLFALMIGVAILVQPMTQKCRFKHDRWAGAALSALNGVLLALMVLAFLAWSSPRSYETELARSVTTRALDTVHATAPGGLFPADLGRRLGDLEGAR